MRQLLGPGRNGQWQLSGTDRAFLLAACATADDASSAWEAFRSAAGDEWMTTARAQLLGRICRALGPGAGEVLQANITAVGSVSPELVARARRVAEK